MPDLIRAFSLAVVFLSRIPVPVRFQPRPEDWGLSAVLYPAVGLLIGLMLAVLAVLFQGVDPDLLAALLLAVWVLLTGGLHLDGLADAADAWIGGAGDRDKTLAIMKDPYSGPMAVTAVVLVLLVKFAALAVALEREQWQVLLWAPVLGRGAMLWLLLCTPYVRERGLGVTLVERLPRERARLMVLAVALITPWVLGWSGVLLVLVLGFGLLGLRRRLVKRLGGTTGDTLGAVCELTEAAALTIPALA